MKKLMTIVATIAVAISANAATLKWGSGAITLANGDTASKGAVTGYLFLLTADTYSNLEKNTTGKALSDAVYASYGSSLTDKSATGTSSNRGAITLTDPTAYSNGNTAYAAILYIEGDNYMGNIGMYTFTSDLNYSMSDMASKIGGVSTAADTAWSSVPEPTSGLLMLLGICGLALRRRRA